MVRLLTIAAIAVAAACGNSTSYGSPPPPPPPGPPPPPPPGGHSTTITLNDNFFSPTPDTVAAGTVTFSWAGANNHNVTWVSGPGTLPTNSTTKTSGTYTPTLQAGTYTYHCTIHAAQGMSGTLVVTP